MSHGTPLVAPVAAPRGRPLQRLHGRCHCGALRYAWGVKVFCLDGFNPAGIPLRATAGAAMD